MGQSSGWDDFFCLSSPLPWQRRRATTQTSRWTGSSSSVLPFLTERSTPVAVLQSPPPIVSLAVRRLILRASFPTRSCSTLACPEAHVACAEEPLSTRSLSSPPPTAGTRVSPTSGCSWGAQHVRRHQRGGQGNQGEDGHHAPQLQQEDDGQRHRCPRARRRVDLH